MEENKKFEHGINSLLKDEKIEHKHNEKTESSHKKEHFVKKERELTEFEKPHQDNKPHIKKHNFIRRDVIKVEKDKSHNEKKNYENMNIKQASETAKKMLSEALDKKPNTVVSISKEGENWDAIIEIVDEEYLPGKNLESMNDIIGIYEVKVSNSGELLSWNKKSSRKRGNM